VLCGLIQAKLAEQLGITFQQLQKYENGSVRVSASRLWLVGKVLEVPVSYFFEGLNENADPAADFLSTRACLELIRDYDACSEDIRKQIFQSGEALADVLGRVTGKETK
jgi:transcriptional regulator with XRE-family HTH domain